MRPGEALPVLVRLGNVPKEKRGESDGELVNISYWTHVFFNFGVGTTLSVNILTHPK